MKPYLTNIALSVILMTSLSAQAQVLNKANSAFKIQSAGQSVSRGGVATGGGDLCEDRIQLISMDLKTWISEDGGKDLQLPSRVTAESYKKAMLHAIATSQVRCVGEGDAGYPVTVEGSPKVCRFDRAGNFNMITCDFKKFQSMSESGQYVLVHHEFAGLSDVERPNGADSDYRVSNQISSSLADQVLKKLVVKKENQGFKQIEDDKLKTYAHAVAIATVQYRCGSSENEFTSSAFSNFVESSNDGFISESSAGVKLIFYRNVVTGTNERRHVMTVTANGLKIESAKLAYEILTDVNVGTIGSPRVVQKWVTIPGYANMNCSESK